MKRLLFLPVLLLTLFVGNPAFSGDLQKALEALRSGEYGIKFLRGWGDVVFDKYGGAKRGRYSAMSRTMRYINGKQLFEGKCADISN